MTDIQSQHTENIESELKGVNSQQNINDQTSDQDEENSRYKDGQILKFVRVRFPGHAKSYPFLIGKRKLMYGQKVVAMSDRGMAVGYINSFPYEVKFEKSMLPIKSISKIATDEDLEKEKEVYKKQKDAEVLCQRLIEKHDLDMNLTHVEFTQYGKKVVFYFIAPARVDFRGLVKDLVSELKLRIELRQISVRDRSASMGALGPCGRELCCSSFLSRYGNVSIKMAKNQSLTLNYSKLNGVCGQLKCCLQYEDDVYEYKRKKLPAEYSIIKTKNGDRGKVHRLHVLSEQFDLLTEKGHIKRYVAEMYDKKLSENEFKMPRHFDNISDETATIIGLNDYHEKIKQKDLMDKKKLDIKAKENAYLAFQDATGVEVNLEEIKELKQDLKQQSKIQFKDIPTKDPETKEAEIKAEPQDNAGKKPHQQNKKRPNNRRNRNYRGKKRNQTNKKSE